MAGYYRYRKKERKEIERDFNVLLILRMGRGLVVGKRFDKIFLSSRFSTYYVAAEVPLPTSFPRAPQ